MSAHIDHESPRGQGLLAALGSVYIDDAVAKLAQVRLGVCEVTHGTQRCRSMGILTACVVRDSHGQIAGVERYRLCPRHGGSAEKAVRA